MAIDLERPKIRNLLERMYEQAPIGPHLRNFPQSTRNFPQRHKGVCPYCTAYALGRFVTAMVMTGIGC